MCLRVCSMRCIAKFSMPWLCSMVHKSFQCRNNLLPHVLTFDLLATRVLGIFNLWSQCIDVHNVALKIKVLHLFFPFWEQLGEGGKLEFLNFRVSTFHVHHEESEDLLLSLSRFSLHISSLTSSTKPTLLITLTYHWIPHLFSNTLKLDWQFISHIAFLLYSSSLFLLSSFRQL